MGDQFTTYIDFKEDFENGGLFQKEDSGVAYSMMWMMVKEKDKEHKDNRECDVFYPFLFRQWVMQAVCEGLCFSFLLMALLAVVLLIKMPEKWMYVMMIVGALIAMKLVPMRQDVSLRIR